MSIAIEKKKTGGKAEKILGHSVPADYLVDSIIKAKYDR